MIEHRIKLRLSLAHAIGFSGPFDNQWRNLVWDQGQCSVQIIFQFEQVMNQF